MWLALVITVFLIFLCSKSQTAHKYWIRKGVVQAKQWPIFGSVGAVVLRLTSVTERLQDTYNAFPEKRYCGLYQFYKPALLIRCPNLIKLLTIKEFDTFPERRLSLPPEVDPLFTNNLFTMRGGQRWHDLRTTLSPSFTSSKLKGMFGLMQQCAMQCIKHYQKQEAPIIVEMKDVYTRYTNDVIATTAFGVSCDSFENPTNEFYLMGEEATNITTSRIFKLLLNSISPLLVKIIQPRIMPIWVEIFFRRLITDNLRLRENQNIIRPDMINLLLEAMKAKPDVELTNEDIIRQAFIFFFAGFETSSTAMSFTSYELALNPCIQKKLQEEVDSIAELTYDSLSKMKYLEMVISESLRMWPPAHMSDRRSVKPITIEAELPGEKPIYLDNEAEIWISIIGLHRDAKYYPQPDKFDPERFSDHNKHNINHLAYLPFGSGPRNCIGSRLALLEVKLIMFYILQHFNIIPTQKTPIPIVLDPSRFFPFPKGGFWLELSPRTNVVNV